MTAVRFVDTNVLLYYVSNLHEEAPKARIAQSLMKERDLVLSVQVLQEFYVQATRPTGRHALSHKQAELFITSWTRFPIQAIDLGILRATLSTKHRYQISYWDAAIIEAARAAGCDVVLSEDLNHGQDYGGVRAMNPFLAPASAG